MSDARRDEWATLHQYVLKRPEGRQPAEKSAGMYLMLFHGRSNPEDTPDDWGFDGPIIGPLNYFHATYLTYVSYELVGGGASEGPSDVLYVHGDLMTFHEPNEVPQYFGDWSLFYHSGGLL